MPPNPAENQNSKAPSERPVANVPADKAVLLSLARQVERVHVKGRLHLHAGPEWLEKDSNGVDILGPPVDEVTVPVPSTMLPPDLKAKGKLVVPVDLASASRSLQQEHNGHVDPRRIDIYNLGRSFCSVLSGIDADDYLRSPTSKASIPVAFQRVIDACLGYSAHLRYDSTSQVLGELQRVVSKHAENVETANDCLDRTVVSTPESSPNNGSAGAVLPFDALGGYEIVEVVGRGGMGDVYRAYHSALDRQVAVKVLPSAIARDREYVERFTEEARSVAKLSHPNIVPIYSIGEDDGIHFYTMRFVAGPSLADILRSPAGTSIGQALKWVRQVIEGLAEAHENGLIHRDIKPSNILIDRTRDTAMLADFGLAKSIGKSSDLTATGVVLGTVDYLSPEQARGETVDHRSDLYSVGILLYRVLGGRLPFVAEAATAVIYQHVHEPPRPVCDLAPQTPKSLGEIVDRLLAKSPDDRYQTADSLLADFVVDEHGTCEWHSCELAVQTDESLTNPRIDHRKRVRSGDWPVRLAASGILVTLAVVAWIKVASRQTERRPPTGAEILASGEWKFAAVENLGPVINSDSEEITPWMSDDGLTLIFASDRPGGFGDFDLWISRRTTQKDSWGSPENLGPNVNSPARERAPSLTADGLTLVFEATRGNGPNKSEIFISHRASLSSSWERTTNLGRVVNTGFNEWNPQITRDGLTIFFSSNRKPTCGYNDLWSTTRSRSQLSWSKARSLGPAVNTEMGELIARPSSDGSVPLIGRRPKGSRTKVEILVSVRVEGTKGEYQPARLIDGPINHGDLNSDPFLSFDNSMLLFSSTRSGGRGESDLYFSRVQPTEE